MSITFQKGGSVKAIVPRDFYLAIAGLQAANNLDWDEACSLAAERIDSNTKQFQKSVEQRAQSLYKSKLMKEMNKARTSIASDAAQQVRRSEDNFRVPCGKNCGKWMYFSNRDKDWPNKKAELYRAFAGWSHIDCSTPPTR